MERQVEDMEKKLDFLVDMHIQHSEQLQVDSAGTARMTLEGGGDIQRLFFNYSESYPHLAYQEPLDKVGHNYKEGKRSRDHARLVSRQLLTPIPTYTERPTVLPISSLQDVSALQGRTSGAPRRNDSPLSLLSVNHDELERSPSGFSISAEREAEERAGEVSAEPGLTWTRPRPTYLAEGETDTDTDPFTPSGGPLPMSSTGEGFGEAVWSTPP